MGIDTSVYKNSWKNLVFWEKFYVFKDFFSDFSVPIPDTKFGHRKSIQATPYSL